MRKTATMAKHYCPLMLEGNQADLQSGAGRDIWRLSQRRESVVETANSLTATTPEAAGTRRYVEILYLYSLSYFSLIFM